MRIFVAHQAPVDSQEESLATSHVSSEHERLHALSVLQIARERLNHTPFSVLHSVECSYAEGVLTLDGHLPSFFLKQVAQECLRDLPHVRQVVNRIEVRS